MKKMVLSRKKKCSDEFKPIVVIEIDLEAYRDNSAFFGKQETRKGLLKEVLTN